MGGARASIAISIATGAVLTACLTLGDPTEKAGDGGAGGFDAAAGTAGWPGGPTVHAERGQTSIESEVSGTSSLTESVDPSHAVLFFTRDQDPNFRNPSDLLFGGQLSNASVHFERISGDGKAIVYWNVVESSAFAVQSGSFQPSGSPDLLELPKPVQMDRAFVLVSYANFGQEWGGDDFVMARLSDQNHVELVGGAAQTFRWQVVELEDGSVVRSGWATLGASEASTSVAITPATNLARSFLLFSYHAPEAIAESPSVLAVRGAIDPSGASLTFDRATSGSGISIAWSLVELATGSVQSVPITLPTGVGDQSFPVTADLSRSIVLSSSQGATARGQGWRFNGFMFGLELLETGVVAHRTDTDAAVEGQAYVVTF